MDRSVVVTGAGQGIGRACFDRLLADGWFVVGIELDAELAAQAEAERREVAAPSFVGTSPNGRRTWTGLRWPASTPRSQGGSTTQASVREGRSIVPTSTRSVASWM